MVYSFSMFNEIGYASELLFSVILVRGASGDPYAG